MAVNPGFLPLSLVRGSAFNSFKLDLKDEKVTVTGTLSPDATGVYAACGNFNGFPLWILASAPSFFVYYSPAYNTYIAARSLTTATLTDFWKPAVAIQYPTGTYLPQGAYTGTLTATDNPVDLTGFTVKAQVRRTPKGELLLDLLPTITTPTQGEITFPEILMATTAALQFSGEFTWDLILIDGTSQWFGPFVAGPFSILDKDTQ